MHKTKLLQKLNDIIAMEDDFVMRIASIDLTTIEHSKFKATSYLSLKNGLTRLLDDSRRHKDIMENIVKILSGDERDEY